MFTKSDRPSNKNPSILTLDCRATSLLKLVLANLRIKRTANLPAWTRIEAKLHLLKTSISNMHTLLQDNRSKMADTSAKVNRRERARSQSCDRAKSPACDDPCFQCG